MNIVLGNKVRCLVTGFAGIATARVEYLNGCVQYCITPQISKGIVPESRYVDVGQLEVIGHGLVVAPRKIGGPQSNEPRASYGVHQ